MLRSRTSTQQKKNTGCSLDHTYLLCVEPGTQKLFKVNMGTQVAEEISDKGKENEQIVNKINREEFKIDQLLDRKDHESKWFFDNEYARNYRCQMVPFYLLEMEASRYPVYVDNSNIEKSLTDDFKIHGIKIIMSESIQELVQDVVYYSSSRVYSSRNTLSQQREAQMSLAKQRSMNGMLRSNTQQDKNSFLLDSAQRDNFKTQFDFQVKEVTLKNISLLSTAEKLIKKVEKEIENQLKQQNKQDRSKNDKQVDNEFKLRKLPGRTQILKFKSVDSYAYGESQLIYFVEIREFLRSRNENLELVLISLREDDMDRSHKTKLHAHHDYHHSYQFPPLIELKPGGLEKQQTFSQMRSGLTNQSIKHALEGKNQIMKTYQNVSLFSWYRPQNFASRSKQAGLSSCNTQNKIPYYSYSADDEILKSCDVHFPLKINLLALRDLAQEIKENVFSQKEGKIQEIQKIVYTCPVEYDNVDVMKLLLDCQALQQQTQLDFCVQKQCLTNPFNNSVNTNFGQAWSRCKFYKAPNLKEKLKKHFKRKPFTMKPEYIQIQAALYLGCRRISCFTYSKPILFSNELDLKGENLLFYKPLSEMHLVTQREVDEEILNAEIKGDLLLIDQLPSCTRICINVILLPEPGSCQIIKPPKPVFVSSADQGKQRFETKEGFVLGSCQVSLFDENFLIRQGKRELRLWPFESFNPRMVCQAECFAKSSPNHIFKPSFIQKCMQMQIEFQNFAGKVGWRLQQFENHQNEQTNINEQIKNTTADPKLRQSKRDDNGELDKEIESLKKVKELLDAYPMELDESKAGNFNVETVLEYKNYIHKLPIFIRLIDFTDHKKIRTCYETLEGSGLAQDMLPEEALALLDGQFGDIKVRIFAVKKLSAFNDSQIALYMSQLVQALKYELFHFSPLAEFLLEKALKNPRVVGSALFWALKANLHWPQSRERFYLILERFLMCCGQFKDDLFKQNLFNQTLCRLSEYVFECLDKECRSFDDSEHLMHKRLKEEELRMKITQQLVIAHARYDDKKLSDQKAHQNSEESKTNQESSEMARRFSHKSGSGSEKTGQAAFKQQEDVYTFDAKTILRKVDDEVEAIIKLINFETKQVGVKQSGKPIYDWKIGKDPNKQLEELNYQIFHNNIPVEWKHELIYIPFAPKKAIANFDMKGGAILVSAQRPLLIVTNLANERETELALKAQCTTRRQNHTSWSASQNSQRRKQFSINENQIQQKANKPASIGNNELLVEDKQEDEKAEEKQRVQLKFIWKYGDDLRQDNLVLQFFKIMDKLWQSNGLDLKMVCYNVMESGDKRGYIEYIDNSCDVSYIHEWASTYRGPFRKSCIMDFFLQEIGNKPDFLRLKNNRENPLDELQNRLDQYNDNFLKSLAGQCVATYVLGIRDRHPGNYLIEKHTGKFLHIDFGHFLDNKKKKLGFVRDREPFILSKELHFFMKHFCKVGIVKTEKSKEDMTQYLRSINSKSSSNDQTNSNTLFKLVYCEDSHKQENQRNSKFFADPENLEEEFERNASKAFLKIRQNADIFINLLILMLVSDLAELNQESIQFVKKALFLNVSEEEATVSFKQEIDRARKQWYRPIDNVIHIIQSKRKKAAQLSKQNKKKKQLSASNVSTSVD